jgi:type VI secretion system protein ImpJ
MHLAQHHFQAQARYFEDSIRFAVSNLQFKPYGLTSLELDHEALRNGTASLVYASGIMPDGLPFHFPDGDPLPVPQAIGDDFLPTQDSHLLLLTVPSYRVGGANCSLDEEAGDEARYVAEGREILDETTGRDTKAVHFGRKNFRLVLDAAAQEQTVSLPLARIRRDGSGNFVYDPLYVPPCTRIGASSRIMDLLARLVDLLTVKADSLAADRSSDRSSLAEYSAKEVSSYWLNHAIQSSLPPLQHHLQTKRSHPEDLYRELVRLGGALCTFSFDSDPRALPAYDHDRLDDCFNALDRHIRDHLEVTLPTTCVTIPLQRHAKYIFLHSGEVVDPRCFGSSEWILGVRSSAGQAQLISDVPELVKFSSQEGIAARVKRGTGGLSLEHLASPPSVIAPRIGSLYFRIARGGPDWKAIQDTKKVAAYVPEAIPEPELQLLVVLQA